MAKSTSKLFQSEEPTPMKEEAMNLPEAETTEEDTPVASDEADVPEAPVDDVQDIDLSAIKKKRFRINGDPNKILELNTSDLSISSRLSTAYEKLTKYMDEVGTVLADIPEESDEITSEQESLAETKLTEIDDKMKEALDYIFDAPVSAVCADGGSMYDPFNGMFRYEHIIDALSKLYETNLNREFSLMRKKVSAKTAKYTKKYHN